MLTTPDVVLAGLIALGLPLRALHAMRALKRAESAALPALRPKLWTRGIVTQWLLAAGVAALWIAHRRDPLALGLGLRPTFGLAGVLVGLATVVALVLRQRGLVDTDPETRERIRARLAGVERLLPRRGESFGLFAALAITAGVCEELLFRGFLWWCFSHVLPFWGAGALQAACFGLGHAYQGPRGILLTGIAGAFFTLVVALSGSLWPAMLMHALMDLHAGDMARRAFGTPAARDA